MCVASEFTLIGLLVVFAFGLAFGAGFVLAQKIIK